MKKVFGVFLAVSMVLGMFNLQISVSAAEVVRANLASGRIAGQYGTSGAYSANPASLMFDGDRSGNYWSKAAQTDLFAWVDLGGIYAIDEIFLVLVSSQSTVWNIDVSEESSNGPWTRLGTTTLRYDYPETGMRSSRLLLEKPVKARFVKATSAGEETVTGMVREFEVWGRRMSQGLEDLSVSGGVLLPKFDPGKFKYTVSLSETDEIPTVLPIYDFEDETLNVVITPPAPETGMRAFVTLTEADLMPVRYEIKFLRNIARGKTISSSYTFSDGPRVNLIDGDYTSSFNPNVTTSGTNAWATVDLGSVRDVSSVDLYMASSSSYLNKMRVYYSTTGGAEDWTMIEQTNMSPLVVTCPDGVDRTRERWIFPSVVQARYIKIEHNTAGANIQLREMEIFGPQEFYIDYSEETDKVAIYSPVTQDVNLIAASYNDCQLIDVKIYPLSLTAAVLSAPQSLAELDKEDALEVKLFVWKAMEGNGALVPVVKNIIIP